MKDVKLKKWNSRKIMVAGVACTLAAVTAGFFMPKYGLVNKRDKESAVESAVERYTHTVDRLKATTDSLGGELARKDTTLAETVSDYNRQLGNVSDEHKKARERLTKEYERKEAAAMEALSKAREEASLDAFLAKYPRFDKDRDYVSSVGYWSSKPSKGALDFGDYLILKRSLEFVLEGQEKIVDDVLAGRAIVMSGEKAKGYDMSVADDRNYVFVADENGNPKGFAFELEHYTKQFPGRNRK